MKVTPNLETARKKVLNEDVLKWVNKYDLLKDLEERNSVLWVLCMFLYVLCF